MSVDLRVCVGDDFKNEVIEKQIMVMCMLVTLSKCFELLTCPPHFFCVSALKREEKNGGKFQGKLKLKKVNALLLLERKGKR